MDKQRSQDQTRIAELERENAELLRALKAFVTRGSKVSGFEAAYSPWIGELVNARALIAKAEGR